MFQLHFRLDEKGWIYTDGRMRHCSPACGSWPPSLCKRGLGVPRFGWCRSGTVAPWSRPCRCSIGASVLNCALAPELRVQGPHEWLVSAIGCTVDRTLKKEGQKYFRDKEALESTVAEENKIRKAVQGHCCGELQW